MKAGLAFHPLLVFSLLCLGCGTTQQRDATQQLLTSAAVDRSVAQIDFRALSGKTVYFDTTYLKDVKGVGFVNAEYITSSLRQQLVAARCLLRDEKKDAEYVVEARIGTLGMDQHEITYGIPASNFLNAASRFVPNSPPLPTIPELAVAKRNEQLAAVKIGAFAYQRETGEPVWQSGISPIRSKTKDLWVLGAGPFQRGDIHGGTQFAGAELFSLNSSGENDDSAPLVVYSKPAVFSRPKQKVKLAEKTPPEPTASKPKTAAVPPTPEPSPAEVKPPQEKTPPAAVAESSPRNEPATPDDRPHWLEKNTAGNGKRVAVANSLR